MYFGASTTATSVPHYICNDSDGNELLGILHANLYGNPEAAFTWFKTLSKWMLDRFNEDGWSAFMSRVDRAACASCAALKAP